MSNPSRPSWISAADFVAMEPIIELGLLYKLLRTDHQLIAAIHAGLTFDEYVAEVVQFNDAFARIADMRTMTWNDRVEQIDLSEQVEYVIDRMRQFTTTEIRDQIARIATQLFDDYEVYNKALHSIEGTTWEQYRYIRNTMKYIGEHEYEFDATEDPGEMAQANAYNETFPREWLEIIQHMCNPNWSRYFTPVSPTPTQIADIARTLFVARIDAERSAWLATTETQMAAIHRLDIKRLETAYRAKQRGASCVVAPPVAESLSEPPVAESLSEPPVAESLSGYSYFAADGDTVV